MIEFMRKIAFKIVPENSFLGKIAGKLLTREMVLYVVFGVLTTAVNLVAFWLFNRLFASVGWDGVLGNIFVKNGWTRAAELFSKNGSEYLDSTLLAWVVGVLFAFFTNKTFVFESKSYAPSVAVKEFTGFVGARVFSLFVELLFMFIMVTLAGLNELVAKIIVGVIVVIINYVFSKLFIFRKKDTENGQG